MNFELDPDKCRRCQIEGLHPFNDARELHECPREAEFAYLRAPDFDDDESELMCNCCEGCTNGCAADI